MCELFAMSSSHPANVRFSLEAFSRHGGLEGPHKDGWGIAYYVDEDVRLFKEPHRAFDSAGLRFLQDHPFLSRTVLAHIRRATLGAVAMKNCQPFVRELGGRMHAFAHNGHLDMGLLREQLPLGAFHPVGDTDSEYAFCALLEQLRRFSAAMPQLGERVEVVSEFAATLRSLGPANFIYSDGDAMFIHGHKRFRADAAEAKPPGLHVLSRHCTSSAHEIEAKGLLIRGANDQSVLLAASVPLTADRGWRPLGEGELLVARLGEIVSTSPLPAAH